MNITKSIISDLSIEGKFSDDAVWFDMGDDGCLKIKASKDNEKGKQESCVVFEKKTTDRLKKFLDSFKRE